MKFRSSQRGASAVEFALILPLLLAILFGIIEFGAVLYNQAVITNASREGARFAAGYYTNPANATSERPNCGNIQTYVADRVNAYMINFTSSTPFGASNVSCPTGTPYNDYSGYAGFVDTIRVEYQYGWLVLGNVIRLLIPGASWASITLAAQTSMRDENQN